MMRVLCVCREQRVLAGVISATYTQVTGSRLDDGTYRDVQSVFAGVKADEELTLVVHAYDQFNNSITTGGEATLMYMQVSWEPAALTGSLAWLVAMPFCVHALDNLVDLALVCRSLLPPRAPQTLPTSLTMAMARTT